MSDGVDITDRRYALMKLEAAYFYASYILEWSEAELQELREAIELAKGWRLP